MQLGKYELLKKIATGGMAEVFLARAAGPKGFQKILVVKRILPHLQEDPTFVDMFLSEAKLAAQFSHPNIVQIFDFGEVDNVSYIAMEFVDGPNLRTLQGRAIDFGTPLPLGVCAKIVSLACEGLSYAHDFVDPTTGQALGVVHRDISPDNLLVARNGYVKVVDFGIAKATTQSHKTRTGTIKGKFGYMAPEQLQNQPLDRRTDVFALGMVLYELVTGTKPYDGSSEASTLKGILFEPFIPAVSRRADVPRELGNIIDRALAKEREQRYPDCRTLQGELERYIASLGQPVGTLQISELVASLALPNVAVDLQGTPAPRMLATPSPSQAVQGSALGLERTAASAKSGKHSAVGPAPVAAGSAAAMAGEEDPSAFAATQAKASAIAANEDPSAFAATQAKASAIAADEDPSAYEATRAKAVPPSVAPAAEPGRKSRVAQAPSVVVDPAAFAGQAGAPQAQARPARDAELEAAMARVRPSPLRWILPLAAFAVLGTCGVGYFAVRSAARSALRREERFAERVRRADEAQAQPDSRFDDARLPPRGLPSPGPGVVPDAPPSPPPAPVAEVKPEKVRTASEEPEPAVEEKLPQTDARADRRDGKGWRRRKKGEPVEAHVASAAEPAEPVTAPPPPPPEASSPAEYEAVVASGTKLLKAHKGAEALEIFQKAISMVPGRPEGYTGEGWTFLELSKPEAAVKSFRRALKIRPKHGSALVGLGKAYQALGNEEAGAQFLLQYLDLYPDGPLAEMAREATGG